MKLRTAIREIHRRLNSLEKRFDDLDDAISKIEDRLTDNDSDHSDCR
jgi:predicted  nucleic acid-binding Zn-ribbon protein